MKAIRKYDDIRAIFIFGTKTTLKALAEEHGVSYANLRRAAARGGWTGERRKALRKELGDV